MLVGPAPPGAAVRSGLKAVISPCRNERTDIPECAGMGIGCMTNARTCLWMFLGLLLCGPVTWANAGAGCPAGLSPVTEFRLFFGLTDAAGNTVSENEWESFLKDTITPCFRAGLTVIDASGQWLEPSGSLQNEAVKVVIGAVSTDAESTMRLVDEISAEFEAMFAQDPVFRMSGPGCAGLFGQ